MKIESVDFFYVAMPTIEDKGDGSQDALLVRVRAGGYEGWGECEASPLVSIAAYVTPMSHSGMKPLSHSVEGFEINNPQDLVTLRNTILTNSFDLLQTPHTLSGLDIALWDLLAKKEGVPIYELMGYKQAYPKTAYASMLFGDTPENTASRVSQAVKQGFKAVKLGWGIFGKDLNMDISQLEAARAAAGKDVRLLVDAGTIWSLNPEEAEKRLASLEANDVVWLEEPYSSYDFKYYSELASKTHTIRLAGGEGAHNPEMAFHMIDYGKVGFIQIDTGRIGGLTPALQVVDYAQKHGVHYVNHTFTTALALSASIQPFAGIKEFDLCEFPFEASPLAVELNAPGLHPDENGLIHLPQTPGLGVPVNHAAIARYLVPMTIEAGGKVLYQTPSIDA